MGCGSSSDRAREHTVFAPPGSIGVTFRTTAKGAVLVDKCLDGSPLKDAVELTMSVRHDALLSGDRIIFVNDTPTDGLGLKELQQLLAALEPQEKRLVVRKGTGHKIHRDAVEAEELFQATRRGGGTMRRVRYAGDAATAGGMGAFGGVGPGPGI